MSDAVSSVKRVMFRAGSYRYPVTITIRDDRFFFSFGYNPKLIAEIKAMQGAKWHGFEEPPIKQWSVPITDRNAFQINYLMERNPYAKFDAPLVEITTKRPLYTHQRETKAFILTRKTCIVAEEMGLGKSLAAIEAIEEAGYRGEDEVWWVAPKSGIYAVERELRKWETCIRPRLLSYPALVKIIKQWQPGIRAPKFVVFDESSKLKNPTSQRTQAAMHLAKSMRSEWQDKCFIVLMSGTPAPKSPIDWWAQCEIAQPGFLKEGDLFKFKRRLCIIEQKESISGGVFPHVVTWLDNENKCAICGKLDADQPLHMKAEPIAFSGLDLAKVLKDAPEDRNNWPHPFVPSSNEVKRLYSRMNGLVLVKFKKDCLDLPEKRYEIIRVTPTVDILRAVKLIKATSKRAIEALTRLRELSDGFQYTNKVTGSKICDVCMGLKTVDHPTPRDGIDPAAPGYVFRKEDFVISTIPCLACDGVGNVPIYSRDINEVKSPKDQVFIDEMDLHEDIGRLVVWGGFTGTIDRLIMIAHQYGWATLRFDKTVDARDETDAPASVDKYLDAMDYSSKYKEKLLEEVSKLVFIGNPEAGGMGLTLTASPTALFYSNSFKADARWQSEDRGHRAGMDMNRGYTVKDIIHLPTDEFVLTNLLKKRNLQNLTMGELEEAMRGL